MKEFTLEIPVPEGNEKVIENVKGFDIKEVTIVATTDGTKVHIKYEGTTNE